MGSLIALLVILGVVSLTSLMVAGGITSVSDKPSALEVVRGVIPALGTAIAVGFGS
jgi:hypothetical protein